MNSDGLAATVGRPMRILLLLLLGLVALTSCRRAAPAPIAAAADPTRFPHQRHLALACGACHDDATGTHAGAPARPGRDHAPCDDGRCHQDAFLQPPGPLCGVCHTRIDVGVGVSPLRPYPRIDSDRRLPARFSHRRHLDRAAMDDAVGFHVACTDCHPVGDDPAGPALADHAACARCHAAEAAPPGAPPMSACGRCHDADGGRAPRRRRLLIRADLRFDHRSHQVDLTGAAIGCASCHPASADATGRADHAVPSVAACVACHDDQKRAPATMAMRACATCHRLQGVGGGSLAQLGTIAPRNHLPGTERPVDHTLAFRPDHGDEAKADARRCGGCHTERSGSPIDTCDECHQVMRPSDHVITWRELDHGGDALAQGERCATCHVADYCVACHAQPPRSHLPRGTFAGREHGDQARLNLRACTTCHQPDRDCSPCHVAAGRAP